jgi:dehydrogenase/reductase SDR family member 1
VRPVSIDLKGRVAVVTGGSRGVGRGVALALGDAGMTVVVTGRTVEESGTAEEVTRRGGVGIARTCDHADDAQVRALFEAVGSEHKRLDVLVNNVFHIPKQRMWGVPFWKQPVDLWDQMHTVGLRSHYVASVFAAPLMVGAGSGLIVNISSFGGASFQLNVAYGVGKAGVDRLAADMAHDLRAHGVAALSLWPGIVRTEYILEHKDQLPFSLDVSESPELTGRAVAALAADPKVMERSGKVWVVAELAKEYGFTDVDGTRPPSLRASTHEKEA